MATLALSKRDKKRNLVRKIQEFKKQIKNLKKSDPERKAIVAEIIKIQDRLSALKPKLIHGGLEFYVIEVAKELLEADKFQEILEESQKRFNNP